MNSYLFQNCIESELSKTSETTTKKKALRLGDSKLKNVTDEK